MDEDDQTEYVRLLSDHQALIRAFIISLMPGAPGVDDVIQEVNTVLWVKRAQFTLGTSFKAWAMAICRFQVMTQLRKLRQQRWVVLDDDVAELLVEDMEEGLDPLVEEMRHRCLSECLAELRESDRELLMERYWQKTRLQDFAVVTNRSVNGLRVNLFRLRAILKRCIERKISRNPATS